MTARSLFGMPARRRRARSLLAAAVACAITMSAVPAGATESSDPLRTVTSTAAANPTSDVGRFVTLWDARFRSGDAFQAYLDSDQQYDDGYNDRRPEEQAMLVRALVEHWRATDPGFRDYVLWEPTPEGEPTTDEIKRGPNVDEVLTIVDAIVFHKEEFKRAIRGEEEGTGADTPEDAPEAPAASTPADPLGEQAGDALRGVLERAQALLDSTTAKNPVDQVLAPLADQVNRAPAQQVLDRLPTSGDVAGVDLPDVGRLPKPPAVLPPLGAAPADLAVPAVAASAGFGPENLVYGVCWALPSTAEQCTSSIYVVGLLTALPGQTAGIDVDNNLLTGTLGVDLEVGLVIDPIATPGGLTATVSVKRLSSAANNAKGVIRYALPGSDKEIRVGFDGRPNGLQGQQTVTAVFEDINALSASDVRIKATVAHNGTPGVATVALVTDFLGTATPDWLKATTSFVRAPASHTTRLVLKRTGTTGLVRVESTHGSAALPDIKVDADARLGVAQVKGAVTFTEVPGSTVVTAITDDASNTTNVTYTATSQLKRLQAAVVMTPNAGNAGSRYVAALDLHRLPTTMTLSAAHAQVTYNASSAIGATTGLGVEASLEEHVTGTLQRRAYLGLSNAPTHVSVTRTPSTQRYVLDAGAGIALAKAAYYDRALLLTASLDVNGFPGHTELTMPTASDPRVAWTASAATSSVAATVSYGVWQAGLTVTNVPASMSFVPGTTSLDVTATGGTPAGVTAYLTNTGGVYPTSPNAGDNYATLLWRKLTAPQVVPGGTITTQVQAAVKMTGITKAKVTPGPSTTFHVEAGGGAPLYLLVRIEDLPANKRAYADARIVNFPGKVTGTIGTTTTITASSNADLTAYAEFGPLVTWPALPNDHGVTYRRTASAGGLVHRGRVWLTGLPTSVTFEPGKIVLGGLRPSQPRLVADVQLLDNANAPLLSYAELNGIPTGVPHTVTVTWSTAPVAGGYQTVAQATTSGATFGSLTASLSYDRYSASVTTSALPSSMKATVTEVEGRTTFDWQASATIASITAGFQSRPTPATTWAARASVTLTDIPSSFSLAAGRDPSGSGPLVTYTSNGSALLDATVVADGSLKTASTTVNANLFFKLVNLAPSVAVSKLGNGFKLASSGRTSRIEARVSAKVSMSKAASGTASPAGWVKFPWQYEVNVAVGAKNLSAVITDVSGFEADAGLVSRLAGDYGTFHLSWERLDLNVNAKGRLDAQLDLWVCKCTFNLVNATLSFAGNVNPSVRLYQDAWQTILNKRYNFFCSYLDFGVKTRPQPIGTVPLVRDAVNPSGGINLTGTIGVWRTNWATPVLFNWNLLSDVVTGISVHGGGFVSAWSYAKWTCW